MSRHLGTVSIASKAQRITLYAQPQTQQQQVNRQLPDLQSRSVIFVCLGVSVAASVHLPHVAHVSQVTICITL